MAGTLDNPDLCTYIFISMSKVLADYSFMRYLCIELTQESNEHTGIKTEVAWY